MRLNSDLHIPLTIKNASQSHTMSFKIKCILNFGEICLNSKLRQKKNLKGEIWWPKQETGGFMQHSGVSPSSERVGMYVGGYLFIMARARVSREGGQLSGQSAGLAVQSQVMTASQICSWCSWAILYTASWFASIGLIVLILNPIKFVLNYSQTSLSGPQFKVLIVNLPCF